jgi:hypothetical protein
MEVTGLGIVFDPIQVNVIPSLFLSLWKRHPKKRQHFREKLTARLARRLRRIGRIAINLASAAPDDFPVGLVGDNE